MRLTVLAVAALVLAAGCASPATDATDATESPSSAAAESPAPAATPADSPAGSSSPRSPASTGNRSRPGVEIITADSEYGPMLFDGTGQPIYLFTAETDTRPACYDQCAQDWPPVITTGQPRGSGAVRDRLLGTTRRSNGATQVTYNGRPLYFYADEGKYQVLCHDVTEYGGTWLVVEPDGTAAPS